MKKQIFDNCELLHILALRAESNQLKHPATVRSAFRGELDLAEPLLETPSAILDPSYPPVAEGNAKVRKVFSSNECLTDDQLAAGRLKIFCRLTCVSFLGKTLCNPVLDIHYNARADGKNFVPKQKLVYALVISVDVKQLGNLYNQIIRKYAEVS